MVGLKMFVLALIFALGAVLMEGGGSACGDPSWLFRAAADSIGHYSAGPEISASSQVCLARSFRD